MRNVRRIVLSCCDAGIWLGKLEWSSWSRGKAVATGRYYENTCTPRCSEGHTVSRPVKVTLTAPVTCPGHAHRVFGYARFGFPTGAPAHAYRHFPFDCPP